MSLLSMIRGEKRAIDASQFALAIPDEGGVATDAGINVTNEGALKLLIVYTCVRLVSNTISALPLDVFRRSEGVQVEVDRTPPWVEYPNPENTRQEFLDRVMESLLVYGNAYVLIAARNALGFPTDLWVLHPEDVKVERPSPMRKVFKWGPERREFSHYTARRPDGEVLHIMGLSHDGMLGISPIDAARQNIGMGLAMDKYGGKLFGQGTLQSGVIELPQGSTPDEDSLKRWGAEWRRKFSGTDNAWKVPVLGNGAQWKPITIPNDQAQFLESRKFTRTEIAGLYGVPPHMVADVEKSTSWGTGIEQQSIGFVNYTLLSWILRLENAFTQLLPRGQFVKLNVNGLLRGDFKSRMEGYQIMRSMGIATGNELRALEDMRPLDGLDEVLVPANHTLLSTLLVPPEPPPTPEPTDEDEDAA